MRFDNGSLFVNTGRKPLSAMQRRKKNTRNYVFGAICLTVIAVLCIFVGLILHVWLNYDATSSETENPPAVIETEKKDSTETKKPAKEAEEKKTEEKADKKDTEKKEEKKEEKKTTKKTKKEEKVAKSKYKTSGEETEISASVRKAFANLDGTYGYGYVMLNDESSKYIDNVGKIKNSAATVAFLAEYVCAKIYTGEFDYTTAVGDYTGEQLIDSLVTNGSYDAAQQLISHFGTAKINAYLQEKGYENTHFGSEGKDSYTTVEDVTKLISKFANNTNFFPYSDVYNRMRRSNVRNKIRAELPEGASAANISVVTEGEMIDAAVVYTPSGNYIFVGIANGYKDDGTMANTAIAKGAASVYKLINQ